MVQSDTSSSTAGGPDSGARPGAKPGAQPQGGDDLLARIEATVAAIAEKLSPVPQLERSLRRWRIGFFLLGAISAGVVGFALHVALPEVRGAEAVAALSAPGGEPTYLVALSADGRDLVVRRLTPATASQPLALWLQRDDGTQVALGRIADAATVRLPRPTALAGSDVEHGRLTLAPAGAAAPKPGEVTYAGRLVTLSP